jgi:hypothetical protein
MSSSITVGVEGREVEAASRASEAVVAAWAHGWPVLQGRFPSESAALEAGLALEDNFGSLPQAELLEPDEADLGSEPWRVEVELPGWSVEELLGAELVFRRHQGEVSWQCGAVPGLRAACEAGALEEVILTAGEVSAVTYAQAADGRARRADVLRLRAEVDPAWRALEVCVAEALAAVGLALESDRGPDTLQPVLDIGLGRVGWEATLVGDRVDEEAALRMLAALDLAAPADVQALRLGRRFELVATSTWVVYGGLVAPCAWVPALELESTIALAAFCAGDPQLREFEWLLSPPHGADAAAWYAALGEKEGWDIVHTAGLRWVRVGERWRCVPRWVMTSRDARSFPAYDALDLGPAVACLLPGLPEGLEDRWAFCDVDWQVGDERCFLRIRDQQRHADTLPSFTPAEEKGALEEWLTAIAAVVPEISAEHSRVVVDSTGRRGIAVAVPGSRMQREAFRELARQLSSVSLVGCSPVGFAGWHRQKFLFTLWSSESPPAESSRRWS